MTLVLRLCLGADAVRGYVCIGMHFSAVPGRYVGYPESRAAGKKVFSEAVMERIASTMEPL